MGYGHPVKSEEVLNNKLASTESSHEHEMPEMPGVE